MAASNYAETTYYTGTKAVELVRYGISEESSARHTDTGILDQLNEASDEFARRTLWYADETTLNVTFGDPRVALPDRCLSVREVIHNNVQLLPITIEQIRSGGYHYQSASGTPVYYATERGVNLYLYPSPSGSTTITVKFIGMPTHLTAATSGNRWPILPGYDRALLIYTKMQMSERDATGEGAARFALYSKQWEEIINDALRQVKHLNERGGGGWGWGRSEGAWHDGDMPMIVRGTDS